jgi:hypothetical protein
LEYLSGFSLKPNRKTRQPKRFSGVWQPKLNVKSQTLNRFDNFARFDAAGADFHPTVAARRKLNANALQIGIEPAAGFVVSV